MSDLSRRRGPGSPEVEIVVPASGIYLSAIRTTAAALAARLEYGIDRVEEVRVVADETCAFALARAESDSDLTCRFYLDGSDITVTAMVRASGDEPGDADVLTWTVLSALSTHADVDRHDGTLTVTAVYASRGGDR